MFCYNCKSGNVVIKKMYPDKEIVNFRKRMIYQKCNNCGTVEYKILNKNQDIEKILKEYAE